MAISPMSHDPEPSKALRKLMAKHRRIAIVGGPKSGKTAVAMFVNDRKVVHTDDFKDTHGWSEASEYIVNTLNESEEPFVVEGVRVAHALRKGLEVDAVLVLVCARQPLSEGQRRMEKATHTVLNQWIAKSRPKAYVVWLDTKS